MAQFRNLVVERTHFMPEGNPAPPRPRNPDALISAIIYELNVSSKQASG